jgi:hypothetical protein
MIPVPVLGTTAGTSCRVITGSSDPEPYVVMPFTETGGELSYIDGVDTEFLMPGVLLISKPGATQNLEF